MTSGTSAAVEGRWHIGRRFERTAAVAWANGLGRTTELVSTDASVALSPAGCPPWRLSVATLERPSAFSPLPGLRRVFVPVGGGVVLRVDGVAHEVAEGSPLAFDGGAEVELVSLTAPCHAVNLMAAGPGVSMSIGAAPRREAPVGALALVPLADVPLADGAAVQCFDLLLPGGELRPEALAERVARIEFVGGS